MLDDGQSQPGAAHFAGTGLVDYIEPLEHTLLVLFGDANPGVEDF